ncbi:hypothetical protein B7R22_14055 [Subtercola boreus]|uniref:Amidohydrolase-related domain-containing protein n=1 Tax=Subtercola boreus TaxID=120213 RepID=A0A3E0VU06_9MICO|nr:amidohydrolase family protein [Subtercola boreus]RFA13120.1 hypothetical protein B7R22_14055 [Subtercola boreus]
MTQPDLLIRGGYIATLDPSMGDLPVGDVLIRYGVIAAIGTDLSAEAGSARVIDARGRLVIPGMVDSHRHLWQGALGGATGKSSLLGYSAEIIGQVAPLYTPDDMYAGTLWGALQALNAGITTVADWSHNLPTPDHADANVRALEDSGIRGIFLFGGPGADAAAFFGPDAQRHPDDARRVRDELFPNGNRGRLTMGLALRGPAFSNEANTRADFDYARALGLPMSVHVGMAGFPHSVDTLARLDLLGADVNYAHANQLSPHEFDLIAETGGSIAISPAVDMLMALGAHPATGEVLRRGIPAGLAVDTTTSTGSDLFSEMRIALAAERSRANAHLTSQHEAATEVSLDHRDMLELATAGGARAWWMDDQIGTLAIGKQADVAIVDMRSPHLDGFSDTVATAVMGAGPSDVETVVVAGEILKENGLLVGPAAETARELMLQSRRRIRAGIAAL